MKSQLSLSGEYSAEPLDVQESGVEFREGIAIHALGYTGAASGPTEALWVTPPGEEKCPGVIFVHPAPGNRYTFLDEAVELAQQGAVSLLMDAPWSRGEAWARTMGEPEHDLKEYLRTVKELWGALDWLTAHPRVDASRIAYVGQGLGALLGGILSGVEERIQTYVFIAGVGTFADIAACHKPQLRGPALEQYREVVGPIDPLVYLPFAAPAPLLFQFSLQERLYPRIKCIEFAAAGSEPKAVKWYNSDHSLRDPDARRDRLEWLRTHLALVHSPVYATYRQA